LRILLIVAHKTRSKLLNLPTKSNMKQINSPFECDGNGLIPGS